MFARSTERRFVVRLEDLDRVQPGADARQLADLAAIGLIWDPPVVRQSTRTEHYDEAVRRLTAAGLTYECFCTRREIREAASAPHPDPAFPNRLTADGSYPGTCRELGRWEIDERRRAGRPGALRLRSDTDHWTIQDELLGPFTGAVDDVVLRRNDGVAAYNLAVVVDDAAQGIDQVVRGDDLLTSAPRQAYLGSLLGFPSAVYAHVPLALNPAGQRLAKRDGAVTLADLAARGVDAAAVLGLMSASLGLSESDEPVTPRVLLDRFDPLAVPREPWVIDKDQLLPADSRVRARKIKSREGFG